MNRMEGVRFTRNRQNTRSFGKFFAGNPAGPPAPVAAGFRLKKLECSAAMFADTQVRAQI